MTRVRAYSQLIKMRLSLLVVFSAIFGYMMAPNVIGFDLVTLLWLSLGGMLVTGASNSLNQILEMEYDGQMKRTANRPLVTGSIGVAEAIGFALLCAAGGIAILALVFEGIVPALLGIIAMLSYAFVYTPMKRISPIAVLIGAVPGAMPALIGWSAATGGLEAGAWVLFLIQFIWQFPHFWAIGWVQDEAYTNAGFKMLPGNSGQSQYTATLIMLYSFLLIPVGLLPLNLGMIGWIGFAVLAVAGVGFTYKAYSLYQKLNSKAALGVMFASFIYLPVVQITMMIDKF
ncbi:UNVERIFIED_CONTAM: hypothetical protein GTU68_029086 [Idotea baltica]|nr:hypothetical protein [Idotea baltica]